MNTAFVILGFFIAFFQASSSEPTELTHQITTAIEECVTQLSLDKSAVIQRLSENVVPEDSPNAIAFFACFSMTLDIVDEHGDTDFETLSPIVQDMLRQKMGDVEDAHAKAKSIATAAIDHCKDAGKDTGKDEEGIGLSGIKIRNCICAFSQKSQTH